MSLGANKEDIISAVKKAIVCPNCSINDIKYEKTAKVTDTDHV